MRTEAPPGAPPEPGHGASGVAGLDELFGDADGELLAGLALPDDEAAAGILTSPAGVALAVLHDGVPADGTGTEAGARDADVLKLGVEVLDGLAGEAAMSCMKLSRESEPCSILPRRCSQLPVISGEVKG